jgi:hypothetical protein
LREKKEGVITVLHDVVDVQIRSIGVSRHRTASLRVGLAVVGQPALAKHRSATVKLTR